MALGSGRATGTGGGLGRGGGEKGILRLLPKCVLGWVSCRCWGAERLPLHGGLCEGRSVLGWRGEHFSPPHRGVCVCLGWMLGGWGAFPPVGWGLGVGVGALPLVEQRSKVGAGGSQPPWGVCRYGGGAVLGGPSPRGVFVEGTALGGSGCRYGVGVGAGSVAPSVG